MEPKEIIKLVPIRDPILSEQLEYLKRDNYSYKSQIMNLKDEMQKLREELHNEIVVDRLLGVFLTFCDCTVEIEGNMPFIINIQDMSPEFYVLIIKMLDDVDNDVRKILRRRIKSNDLGIDKILDSMLEEKKRKKTISEIALEYEPFK